ncbi:purple acid phosphatase family protein [Desmospora activa]|uniref:Calcineurin-like phosphoesterase family protein n=1 Tax=Desmospora activa DSM 45169 TaxID=1121389 RepID=A0A2T4ZDB6_9BACL|nr:metallophosphoesterase family protein [Desmospora activa]PTM59885.1 calcineurin-like phosphoesterase family protein [Desmospora activa DSM 45169]
MNKKLLNSRWIRISLFLLALFVVVPSINIALANQTAIKYPDAEKYKPTPVPDRIVLTWKGEPTTTQAVSWRTDTSVLTPQAQIAVAEDGPNFKQNATTVTAESSTDVKGNQNYTAKFHTVQFKDLTPNTKYLYRVGDGVNWSEWFQFTTASTKNEPFAFLYVGDAQNDILEHWSRVIRKAYSDLPDARFIIHAGDLINHGDADEQWGEWFEAGGWLNGMVPSIPTPGNHEYAKIVPNTPSSLSPYWRPQFALPENGPAGHEETVYYTDYQGMRIISLDTNKKGAELDKQAAWLEEALKNNPNKWTVITFHHPIFANSPGRDNVEIREKLLPIVQKYNVDLVLQGHDHSYARGHVSNLPTGVTAKDPKSNTVFVVSVSGPKMYDLTHKNWEENGAEVRKSVKNTQLYQLIRVDGNVIRYEARTATGSLFDGFELKKSANGEKEIKDLKMKDK